MAYTHEEMIAARNKVICRPHTGDKSQKHSLLIEVAHIYGTDYQNKKTHEWIRLLHIEYYPVNTNGIRLGTAVQTETISSRLPNFGPDVMLSLVKGQCYKIQYRKDPHNNQHYWGIATSLDADGPPVVRKTKPTPKGEEWLWN